jgi:hypothetical protein
LPHQPSRTVLNTDLMTSDKVRRHIGLNGVQAHDFLYGIMQREIHEIDLNNPRKPVGKLPKELVEISVSGNGLRHFQQRLIALYEGFAGRNGRSIHSIRKYGPSPHGGSSRVLENSTRFMKVQVEAEVK